MKAVSRLGWGCLAAALVAVAATGCGTPGAPLPPSLNLPEPVTNLAAVRNGDQVALTWTMPKRNTEKMSLKQSYAVSICRKDATGNCALVPSNLVLAPGAHGAFTDSLPPGEVAGSPRAVFYFVELKNRRGRSAGLSNPAQVLAGEAPTAVVGLAARVRKGGVLLRWVADPQASADTVMRLHRKLLTPQPQEKAKEQTGLGAPAPEPLEQALLVQAGPPGDKGSQAANLAFDQGVRFGQVYEYRAQRIARETVDGQVLELAGPLSEPVRVETTDVFPPAVPTGLAAVANSANAELGPSIDLSWQPVSDSDLAGYQVFRREARGTWAQVSPAARVVGPAFHDDQVQPGHTYSYAVTAVDHDGHASERSVETEETVPNP
jgi:hypothetical protein